MAEQEAAPRRPGPWVIVPSIPDVTRDLQKFPPGEDFSIDWEAPPRGSCVTLPQRVVADPFNYLYITAADRSGRLLLYAAQGRDTEPFVVDDTPDVGLAIRSYLLCDATTRTVSVLPNAGRAGIKLGMVGLIAHPRDGGRHMVAELMPVAGTDRATLLCYTTGTDAWVEKALTYRQQHPPWERKSCSGVITHAGRLWWVDLSYGLLTCEPFAEHPKLHYVALPNSSVLATAVSRGEDLDKRFCVKVSGGELRCFQIHGPACDRKFGMWTLTDLEHGVWRLEYDVLWSDIFTGTTYASSTLPSSRVPTPALLHPKNPNVVYFQIDMMEKSCMFALDVPARRLLECEEYLVTLRPTIGHYSSRLVHAWELPLSVTGETDGLVKKDNDTNAAEDSDSEKLLSSHDMTESDVPEVSLPTPNMVEVGMKRSDAVTGESPVSDAAEATAKNEASVAEEAKEVAGGGKSLVLAVPTIPSPDVGEQSVCACFICGRHHAGKHACDACLARVGVLLKKLKAAERVSTKSNFFCLSCGRFESCTREECQGMVSPLLKHKGEWTVWLTGRERWARLFEGVQRDKGFGPSVTIPVLVHRSEGIRCQGCEDYLGPDGLYMLYQYCSFQCQTEESSPAGWATHLLSVKFAEESGSDDSFCVTCSVPFSRVFSNNHKRHKTLRVVFYQNRACLDIPRTSNLAKAFQLVKDPCLSSCDVAESVLVPLQPFGPRTPRCLRCNARLKDGGGQACSLACALPLRQWQPRVLELRSRLVSSR